MMQYWMQLGRQIKIYSAGRKIHLSSYLLLFERIGLESLEWKSAERERAERVMVKWMYGVSLKDRRCSVDLYSLEIGVQCG